MKLSELIEILTDYRDIAGDVDAYLQMDDLSERPGDFVDPAPELRCWGQETYVIL